MENLNNVNKQESLSLITIYRSLYILKKKFEKYKDEISKIYTKYFVKDKNNYNNIRCKIIKISSFKSLLKDVCTISNFSIIKLTSMNEIFISDLMSDDKIEEKLDFSIEQINNYITENLNKYNNIFYNKKIKPEIEISNIDSVAEDFTDYYPIAEYDKKGTLIYYYDQIKELNNENKGKLKSNEISLQEEYENNLKENDILYIETLPVIIADFIQSNSDYVIINNELDDNNLNNEIKSLFDSEIVKKIENDNTKLKEQIEKISVVKNEEKINNILQQKLELEKQIKLYEDILNNKKKSGHDTSYIEEFLKKLNEEKLILQNNINKEEKIEKENIDKIKSLERKKTEEKKKIIIRNMNKKRTIQMENRMNNFLQEIFYFYANQHFAMAHSPTFDEIAFAKVHMDMAEFSKFCIEFEIKIPKEKIVELFKKNTKNKKDMTFEEFKICLYKIGNAMNENKKDNIERRLRILNERIEKFKLENDDDDNENKKYNNISNIDNSKMIGNQIEKDQKEINELKKEYDRIKNFNYKDIFFEFQTYLGMNDPKIYRKKMKGFINPYHNNNDNFVNMNIDNNLIKQKRKEEFNRIQKMKNDLMIKNNYNEKKRMFKNNKSNYDIMKEEQEKKKERIKKKKEMEIKKQKEKEELEKQLAILEEEKRKNVFSFDRIENSNFDEFNINENNENDKNDNEKLDFLFQDDSDNSDEDILNRFGNKKKEKEKEKKVEEENKENENNNNIKNIDLNNNNENKENNVLENLFKNKNIDENILITQQIPQNKFNNTNTNTNNNDNDNNNRIKTEQKPITKSKIKINHSDFQILTENKNNNKYISQRYNTLNYSPSNPIYNKNQNSDFIYSPISNSKRQNNPFSIHNYNKNYLKNNKGKILMKSGENIVKSINHSNNMNYIYTSVNNIPNSRNQISIDENYNFNNNYYEQMNNNRIQSGNTKLFKKKMYK